MLHQDADALSVPLQAVTRNGNSASVVLVNPQDRIELRPVQLGLEGATRVEVLSGLSLNDRVVIGNASDYHAGEKVQPKPFQEAAKSEEF